MIDLKDRVLVIGASGLLGKAIVSGLFAQGYTNVLTPSSSELDCLDGVSTARYFEDNRPSSVYHLAAIVFGLKGNLENQLLSLTKNTLINHNVLNACANTRVKKTFFAGTVAAYGFPYLNLPLRERDLLAAPPHPGEFGYAAAKRHALNYLEIMKADLGLDFVYGVFTNLYGPHDRFDIENGHVIPSLIRKAALSAAHQTPFEVWGNPFTTRDYLYSLDAANAAIFAMNKMSGIINIASGTTSEMAEVVKHISDCFPALPTAQWLSDMPVGIPNRSVSNVKLSEAGFVPAYSLQTGIRATCDWYSQNEKRIRL
jgi:GDP-L-fucose synthase